MAGKSCKGGKKGRVEMMSIPSVLMKFPGWGRRTTLPTKLYKGTFHQERIAETLGLLPDLPPPTPDLGPPSLSL